MYISDVITEKVIAAWQETDTILISSGTGTGKTYFIGNTLSQFAKKHNKRILLLEPRVILKRQQRLISNGIDVHTYQEIENGLVISNYDFVVLDEAHYLFGDSEFNNLTNESYKKIQELQAIKIWITATSEDVTCFFKQKSISYIEYSVNGGRIVGTLNMIHTDEDVNNIVELAIREKRKVLVVINDTKKINAMYQKYKQFSSVVLGSGNIKSQPKKMRKEISSEIQYIAKEETFSNLVLFATSAIDCGVNIKDWNFSEIIIDGVYDIAQIKQIVGRKRKMSEGETITLFVKDIKNSTLNGYNSSMKRGLRVAQYFKEHGQAEYIRWKRAEGNSYKDKFEILYDVLTDDGYMKKAVNEMKLLYFENTVSRVTTMIHSDKHGLKHTLEKEFGIDANEWSGDSKPILEDTLERYYETDAYWWTKEETKVLAQELGFKDKYNRPITSYLAINGVLEHEYGSKYRIESIVKRKSVNGKSKQFKAVWHIVKVG